MPDPAPAPRPPEGGSNGLLFGALLGGGGALLLSQLFGGGGGGLLGFLLPLLGAGAGALIGDYVAGDRSTVSRVASWVGLTIPPRTPAGGVEVETEVLRRPPVDTENGPSDLPRTPAALARTLW